MSAELTDIQSYAEWHGWNREFLKLITEFGHHGGQPVFGLTPAIIDQIRALTGEQREQLAATPGLLVCFADQQAMQIADEPPPPVMTNPQWRHAAEVFVSALLTYLWKVEQKIVGVPRAYSGQENFLPVLDMTEQAVGQLRARFHDHPAFWSDLMHGVQMDDTEYCALSQLTYIPLAVAEESG